MFNSNDFDTEIVRGVIVLKIDVGTIAPDEIPAYMEAVTAKMTDPRLERQGFIYFYIPTRTERTSMTFIDLATMASVTV